MNEHLKAYGKFDQDDDEFVIEGETPPKPWFNYLWNDSYFSLVAHDGSGKSFFQDVDGHRTDLIAGRHLYLQNADGGTVWSGAGRVVSDAFGSVDAKRVRYGLGYAVFESSYQNVSTNWRIFCPQGLNGECWNISVTNESSESKTVRIVVVLDTKIDGKYKYQEYYTSASTHYDQSSYRFTSVSRHFTSGKEAIAFFTSDQEPDGWDTRWASFYGEPNDRMLPEALKNSSLTNHDLCDFEKGVFALEFKVELKPGETKQINIITGISFDRKELDTIKNKYLGCDASVGLERHYQEAVSFFKDFTAPVQIETPDEDFDTFFNVWLKHQLHLNVKWARGYFNGYRDLCQDTESLAPLHPEVAKERLRVIFAYQYPNGYAPRAWLHGKPVEAGHSDSPVWLAYTVRAIINETGDLSLLNEAMPFYGGEQGAVFEHLRRAMEWYWKDRGENGLCLARTGDWNDVLNRLGADGKGTSTWLTMAYYRALNDFIYLADLLGENDQAALFKKRAAEIYEIVNSVGWDGDWFNRGFTDAGNVIGSSSCKYGTMYLNSQSWAVLSQCTTPDRQRQVMNYVDASLETAVGALTLKDTYKEYDHGIGAITGQRPGCYQNGSAYSHSNTFKAQAWAMLGQADKVWASWQKLLPFSSSHQKVYAEPYVLPNCYFGPEAGYREGESGQSWITGTAGWFFAITVNSIFGLKTASSGLQLRPCLPSHWRGASITKTFRGAVYEIKYLRTDASASGNVVKQIVVNGEVMDRSYLPCEEGHEYRVDVILV